MRIQSALSLDEQADAMKILKSYPAEELQELLTTFDMASLEQCTDFLRRLIGEWRDRQAARNARATEAPPVDSGDSRAFGRAADPRAAYAASVDALRAARAEQERAAQEHATQLASAIAAASSSGPGINVFMLLRLLPPYTATKLMQINAALSPEEQGDAMQVLKSYSVDGMHELLTAFDATPIDECTAFLHSVIADWRAHHAAAELARAAAARAGLAGSGGTSDPVGTAGAAGSTDTSGAAATRSAAGSSDPRRDAVALGASGAAGLSSPAASSGTSSTVDSSSPSSTADPSDTSGAAVPRDAAGSSGPAGSGDAVASSSRLFRAVRLLRAARRVRVLGAGADRRSRRDDQISLVHRRGISGIRRQGR